MPDENSKACTKCGEVKPLSEFYKHPGCKGGHRPECKECVRIRTRQWYADTAEVRRAYNRARYKIPAYKAYVKLRDHMHYVENREQKKAYQRAYHAANPEVTERNRQTRQVRKFSSERQPYTRREIYDRDGGKCRECRKDLPFAPHEFHIDHIVPLSLGGVDTPANVQLMCPPCNREKWANLEGQIHLPV